MTEQRRRARLSEIERIAEDETDPVRRRVLQEEAMWSDREPCGVHCSCAYPAGWCCYCGTWVDSEHERVVRAWHSKLGK